MRSSLTYQKSETRDAPFIWFCRNDPLTRSMSNRQHEIPYSEIECWSVLIFYRGSTPIGYGRISNDYELSWCVAPMFRRQGLATEIIQTLLKIAGTQRAWAQIKEENIYSQRAATRAGMALMHGCKVSWGSAEWGPARFKKSLPFGDGIHGTDMVAEVAA